MGFKYMTAVQWIILPGTSAYRLVLCAVVTKMAGHANNETGQFWATYKTLAREAHCSEISVKRAVPKLIALGLVKVIGQKPTRGRPTYLYQLNLKALEELRYQRDTISKDGICESEDGIRESNNGIRESKQWYPSDTLNLSLNREENREDEPIRSHQQQPLKTGDQRTVTKAVGTAAQQTGSFPKDSIPATVGVTAPHSATPPKKILSVEQEKIKALMIQRLPHMGIKPIDWVNLIPKVLAREYPYWIEVLPELAKYSTAETRKCFEQENAKRVARVQAEPLTVDMLED